MQKSKIAIVGAGPGGLTLARILHQNGLRATLFEAEAHALARPQGGTLDLHADTGQAALRLAGLEQQFLQVARYDDQGDRLYDHRGQLLFAHDGQSADRPEVDRTALRNILLHSIPSDWIQWNQSIQEIREGWFVNEHGPFDLVVGADGAWSRVRPLLSYYKPQYSGLTFLEFGIDDVDRSHPEVAALVGKGKLSAEGPGRSLIVQRNANSHLRGYAVFRVPADWVESTFDLTNPAAALQRLEHEYQDWAPELKSIFRAANHNLAARPIYALPVGHRWNHRPGLTLLGDAAHLMSPFGGEGVNAAMWDAAELARHILSDTIQQYEEEMFERVLEPAGHAAEAAATELSHLGLELTLRHFAAHAAP